MALTINSKSFRSEPLSSKAVKYVGPGTSVGVEDSLTLSREQPIKTKSSEGVSRVMSKTTRTTALGDTGRTAPVIFKTESSLPVGASQAVADAAYDDHIAWLSSAAGRDAFMKGLIFGLD